MSKSNAGSDLTVERPDAVPLSACERSNVFERAVDLGNQVIIGPRPCGLDVRGLHTKAGGIPAIESLAVLAHGRDTAHSDIGQDFPHGVGHVDVAVLEPGCLEVRSENR